MADSSKIAAGLVVVVVAAAVGGGWWMMRDRSEGPMPAAESTESGPATQPEAMPGTAPSASPKATGPAPAPGSVAARIADIEATLREQQVQHLAEATRLGEEVHALRARIEELEQSIRQLEEGKLTRLSTREGKSEDKCNPADPDSRACKRQAALEARVGEAQADKAGLEGQVSELKAEEERLLAERVQQLRAVDEVEDKLKNDPELRSLYTQLAQGG